MSKKLQVVFEDWQVLSLEKEAQFLRMTTSAYIRMAVMEQVHRDSQVRLAYLKSQVSDEKSWLQAQDQER